MGQKTICVLRHGEAMYEQEIVAPGNENDLTPAGIVKVRFTVDQIRSEVGKDVVFFSSPIARTVQTAMMAIDTISPGKVLERRRCLTEQLNYSWSVMQLLVNGGQMVIDGQTVEVDTKRTNPDSKPIQNYGTKDIARIDRELWNRFPTLGRRALAIEPSENVDLRSRRFIDTLGRKLGDGQSAVVVTHDALIRPLIRESEIKSIAPGERLIIKIVDGKTRISKIANAELD